MTSAEICSDIFLTKPVAVTQGGNSRLLRASFVSKKKSSRAGIDDFCTHKQTDQSYEKPRLLSVIPDCFSILVESPTCHQGTPFFPPASFNGISQLRGMTGFRREEPITSFTVGATKSATTRSLLLAPSASSARLWHPSNKQLCGGKMAFVGGGTRSDQKNLVAIPTGDSERNPLTSQTHKFSAGAARKLA